MLRIELVAATPIPSSPPSPTSYSPSSRDYHDARFFLCDACDDYGTGFDYHCSVCEFDLHVGCARLPKTIKHVDH
ncbi:hypothetical protein V6N13_018820 [Hibiscus sabdariffa]|uniref:DC1 domain-containing protein n=1 Tax=Hibiscus sabdariffa TaxID=183260 RepID=A0ABR2EKT8_9ROSI